MNCHSCINSATQYAGIAALEGPQDEVAVMMTAFAERRNVIVQGLNDIPGMSCRMPGGAFYAFPNITATGHTSMELQQGLLEQAGIATIAGTSFGAYGEGYLRFSYASSVENIQGALHRIAELLAG